MSSPLTGSATIPPPTPSPSRSSRSSRGASAVEYGLLLAGVAALIVAAVYLFGGGVLTLFSGTCSKLSAAQSTTSTSCR